jgi:hypothetical protein
MPILKPFHRNYRPVVKGHNSGYSDWAYIVDKEYCKSPEYYTRGFMIIQKDLIQLFESIEPSKVNLKTYSFRTLELLIRICVEVEANFKAILKDNIYTPTDKKDKPIPERNWNINTYKIIDKTHRLSDYQIELPIWHGEGRFRAPFKNWNNDESIDWYQKYNRAKHDRVNSFEEANFETLIDAFAGLAVLISSQFRTEDFQPGPTLLALESSNSGIGGYVIPHFPKTWTDDEKYKFDWATLKNEEDRFQKINYNELK